MERLKIPSNFLQIPNSNRFSNSSLLTLRFPPAPQRLRFTSSSQVANPTSSTAEEHNSALPLQKEKLRVVVKPMEKPRVVLKLVVMQNLAGIALEQIIPNSGSFPLTPYKFVRWNELDEHLKSLLDNESWIPSSHSRMLIKQASDIAEMYRNLTGNT